MAKSDQSRICDAFLVNPEECGRSYEVQRTFCERLASESPAGEIPRKTLQGILETVYRSGFCNGAKQFAQFLDHGTGGSAVDMYQSNSQENDTRM